MFEVVVAESIEVVSSCVDLDTWEEVGNPVCCGLKGGGERGVAVGFGEVFVVIDCFGITFPCGVGEAVLKEERSFWRKVEVRVFRVDR
jgi:hypothetical protein